MSLFIFLIVLMAWCFIMLLVSIIENDSFFASIALMLFIADFIIGFIGLLAKMGILKY